MAALIWVGPVSASNLSGALPAGWRLLVYNHGRDNGIGSRAFQAWADGLGADPLSALGVRDEPCAVAAFSAGHGATEVFLGRTAARRDPRLCQVYGLDAYYTSHNTAPKPGHLAWLSWVRDSPQGRHGIFTTSAYAGKNHPSASASFRPLATALNMAPIPARPRFALSSTSTTAPPDAAYGAGPVRWFDYGTTYPHVQHATVLAREFVRFGLQPPRSAPRPLPPTPASAPPAAQSSGLPLLSLALAALRLAGDK